MNRPGAGRSGPEEMTASDENLALAAGRGDGAALGILLARHYDRLFALCWRLTGSRAEAEDLTQDICAALPARLAGFRADARLTTWLYRVAVNAAHDRRRRQASATRAATGWGDWEIARTELAAEERTRLNWLGAAMRELPADLRDTLALVLDDLTQAEVAEVLGIAEGTVAWRVSRAKQHLRAIRAREER